MLEKRQGQGENKRVINDPSEVEEANLAKAVKRDPNVEISDQHRPFLEKVMLDGGLSDPYDARDITEVVFRVMRDLMTKETINRVEGELHEDVLVTRDKTLQMEIADLWKDTNPIVGFLSKIRQPLTGPAPMGIDDQLFIRRVNNEAGIGPDVDVVQVIKAVFAATKIELSEERQQEISACLPGQVKTLWDQA